MKTRFSRKCQLPALMMVRAISVDVHGVAAAELGPGLQAQRTPETVLSSSGCSR